MSKVINVNTLPEFDIAQHLKTDADVAEYLRQVLEEGDSSELAAALGHIARARGMTEIAMNPNRKPTHPGAVLREDVLPELGWTQGELATRLMVSRQTVSDILHEKKSVTAEMASRIESWLRMQEALDLWAAEMKFKNNPGLAPKTLAA